LSSGVGTSDPGVHSGHSEQPRPEPVRRTAPPVAMMRVFSRNEAHAARGRKRGLDTATNPKSFAEFVPGTGSPSLRALREHWPVTPNSERKPVDSVAVV